MATEKEVSELRAEMAVLKKDMGAIADTLKKMYETGTEQGKEHLRKTAKQGRDSLEGAWHTVEHEIEERPLTSMAAAFGVGFIIGKLLDR